MSTEKEIALMKLRMDSMEEKIDNIDEKIDMLMTRLLDPDEGLVIRVNKNTEKLDDREKNMGSWMKDINDFHHMKRWKDTVTKALWVVYAALIGFVIKLLFWE